MEINPYLMDFKYNNAWYDAWDVEKGVVWDFSAIQGWRLIAQREPDGSYRLMD